MGVVCGLQKLWACASGLPHTETIPYLLQASAALTCCTGHAGLRNVLNKMSWKSRKATKEPPQIDMSQGLREGIGPRFCIFDDLEKTKCSTPPQGDKTQGAVFAVMQV